MEEIFQLNLLLIYFVYGLSFYTMGVGIAIQYRSYSSFRLAYSLSLLAAFGLLHGISEWGSVFIPVQVPTLGDFPTWKAMALQRLMVSVSYFLLFLFGAKLVSDSKNNNYLWFILPVVFFLGWLFEFSHFTFLLGTDKLISWLLVSESWSRYLLAFPAGLLTAYGLYLQIPEVKKIDNDKILRNLWTATITFIFFALFSGLVVHPYVGGLGKLINNETFHNILGLPIEIFRTITALLITWSISRMLTIFDLEKQREITERRRTEAILRERERIACDLHDDVIQSIYGIGLELQTTLYLMEKDRELAKHQVTGSINGLQTVISALRAYIQGLEKGDQEFELALLKPIEDFLQKTDLKISLNYQVPGGAPIKLARQTKDWKQNLSQIIREALNNVQKHAEASEVKIEVFTKSDMLMIILIDDGKGMTKGPSISPKKDVKHMGLGTMRSRARALGGHLQIYSRPNEGTKITIKIPLLNPLK